MTSVGVVIPIIGRDTLAHAVASALREGFEVVVVSDGFDVSDPCVCQPGVKYARLGRNYGILGGVLHYPQVASTAGAYLAVSEWVGHLGDDDEYVEGAGDVVQPLLDTGAADVWIPGLLYIEGSTSCCAPGRRSN